MSKDLAMESKATILLTGGSGLVGRNILEHPAINQYRVLAPSSRELDLCDYGKVSTYLAEHRPDCIIHAAGKVGGIHANMREPVRFLDDNLTMGRNIVLAAQQLGVKKLLNLGSSCMYPRDRHDALTEDLILKGELEPTNEGYAIAKIATAKLCEYINREHADFKYKTLIPCNIYGRYDKFDPAHSHLVPAIIHKVHQAKVAHVNEVIIWGDGSARREFMYAGDLADAILRAIEHFDDLPDYMNIGLGHDTSVLEYYKTAAEVLGYQGSFTFDLSKPVGMNRKLVNIDKQLSWGWSAKHDLATGIAATYRFYLKEYAV